MLALCLSVLVHDLFTTLLYCVCGSNEFVWKQHSERLLHRVCLAYKPSLNVMARTCWFWKMCIHGDIE